MAMPCADQAMRRQRSDVTMTEATETAGASRPATTPATTADWWRRAVIYQVYVRSFAAGSGTGNGVRAATGADERDGTDPSPGHAAGVGDLAGVRERLPYLAELGVDALWFSPWYPSPMADAGYDVADYRAIDPLFGSLADAELLIADAHALGIRIILDIVPNHGSSKQQWFLDALAAAPGSPERARYHFRPGRGLAGELPPNNWASIFGGLAWSRTTNLDGTPGEWYLHLFDSEQPDFNWDNPEVRAEFEDVLRFWFARGVDGFRIDSAALLVKDPQLADRRPGQVEGAGHPFVDLDGVHDIHRAWRAIADSYPDRRVLIGEVWLPDQERFARYLRPDELHSAFNFPFLCCAWQADALRGVIDETLASHARVGAPPSWVLSNHDVVRQVTRYGRADTSFTLEHRQHGVPSDLALGTRRARAAALLLLGLPGGAYLYQGEELGLWEVEDLPDELRQDPFWRRSGFTEPGRDGCRVPLPWSGTAPPFGFMPPTADGGWHTWLPQPDAWKNLTAEAQHADPDSMLTLYRRLLRQRRAEASLATEDLTWLPTADDVLGFRRGTDIVVLVNLSAEPVPLPPHEEVLVASGPLTDGRLPADTGVWLRSTTPRRAVR
jgi:alpha-glucosidase